MKVRQLIATTKQQARDRKQTSAAVIVDELMINLEADVAVAINRQNLLRLANRIGYYFTKRSSMAPEGGQQEASTSSLSSRRNGKAPAKKKDSHRNDPFRNQKKRAWYRARVARMSDEEKKKLNERSTELRRHRIARRTEEEKADARKKWADQQRNRSRKHKCPHSTCKWSEVGFKSNPKLLRHIKTQHADTAETIHCKLCGETFKEKYNLTAHLKHKHIEDEEYPCDQCDRVFKWKNSLTEHKRLHTDEAFKCDYPGCGLVTASKQHYETHVRAHKGIKPFKCDECGEAYKYSGSLRRHVKVEHSSDAERFHCDLCNYSTLRRDGLKEHRQKCAKAKQTGLRAAGLGRPLRRNRSTSEERSEENDDAWLEMETTEVDDAPGSSKATRRKARSGQEYASENKRVLRSSTRRRNANERNRESIKVDPDALVADILSVKAEVKNEPADVD